MLKSILDIRTLSFVTVMFCGIFGLGMVVYSLLGRRTAGIGWFGAGVIGSSVGFLFISLRGVVPEAITLVMAHTLIIAGLLAIYLGLRLFTGRRTGSPWYYVAVVALFVAAFIAFTYIAPRVEARVMISSTLISAIAAGCGLLFVRATPPALRPHYIITSLPFFAHALFGAFRLGWTAVGEPMSDLLEGDLVQAFAFISWSSQILLTTFGVLWISSSRLENELSEQARIDPLTRLLNRRALEEIAFREVSRARRSAAGLSVVMIDIDHFKPLNDDHGHPAGDTVLASIAGILTVGLRNEDVVARYGGDEFIAVLPGTDYAKAACLAERIRAEVEATTVHTASGLVSMTVSIGVATFLEGQDEWEALVSRADDALYRAKEDGRNTIR